MSAFSGHSYSNSSKDIPYSGAVDVRRNLRRGAHPIDGELLVTGCFLSVSQIAEKLNTSAESVRRWIHRGVSVNGRIEYLSAFQIGTPWRVNEQELTRFLASIQATKRGRAEVLGSKSPSTAGSAHLGRALAALKARPSRASGNTPRLPTRQHHESGDGRAQKQQ